MRHPEIEPMRDAKPTWKEILIGIMGLLALEIRIKHPNQSAHRVRIISRKQLHVSGA